MLFSPRKITRSMRYLIIALTLTFLASANLKAQDTPREFYRMHKRDEGVRNFKIPGWLIWLGGGLAYNSVPDDDAKVGLKLARKIKKIRILISEDGSALPLQEARQFTQNLKDESGYEDFITVRDSESNVSIMIREKKQKIKDLLVLVRDESEFVFLSMKANIRMKDIVRVINHYLEKSPLEQEKKKKKDKKDKPAQA